MRLGKIQSKTFRCSGTRKQIPDLCFKKLCLLFRKSNILNGFCWIINLYVQHLIVTFFSIRSYEIRPFLNSIARKYFFSRWIRNIQTEKLKLLNNRLPWDSHQGYHWWQSHRDTTVPATNENDWKSSRLIVAILNVILSYWLLQDPIIRKPITNYFS